jgi:hypothetical protein
MALPDKDTLTAEKVQQAYEMMRRGKIEFDPYVKSKWADALSDSLLYGVRSMPGGLGAGLGARNQTSNKASPPPEPRFTNSSMQRMIACRMGWERDGMMCPLPDLTCAKLNEGQAVVFFVFDGKAIVIYDDLNLFPSDALVTQLRILIG